MPQQQLHVTLRVAPPPCILAAAAGCRVSRGMLLSYSFLQMRVPMALVSTPAYGVGPYAC
jgi:hypothetical protein